MDLKAGELRKHGSKVKLSDQPFQVLAMLLERPGEVVTREELRVKLWSNDVFVDFDQGLNKAINRIREALNDSPTTPRFVETLPRRGYRFLVPVSGLEESPESTAAEIPAQQQPASRPRRFQILAALTVLILVVGAGSLALLKMRSRESIDSLAVLPLTLEANNSDLEYLSEGMTENIISNLSQLQRLRVMARITVFHYKGKDMDPRAIGKELGVRAVLTGRLAHTGSEITVSAELVDVSDGSQIWGKQFRARSSEVQALQDEIATALAKKLLKLSDEESASLTRKSTADPEAYRLYMLGRFYWNKRTADGLKMSVQYFEQAVQHDLKFGAAYAGLADAYGQLAWETYPPHEYMPRAKAMATRALELNEQIAEAHTSLAMIAALYNWDWKRAESEFQRAIEINPGYATAHHWYGVHLGAMGRFDESRKEMARALALDPLSLIININSAYPAYFNRQFDEAISIYRKTVEMDPSFAIAHEELMVAYEQKGEWKLATEESVKMLRAQGAPELAKAVEQTYQAAGYQKALRRWLAGLREQERKQYVSPMMFAKLYIRLGDKEEAFAWLQKALDAHAQPLVYLNVDPRYDSIRSDKRFAALLAQIGLP